MKTFKSLLAVVALGLLVACGGGNGKEDPVNPTTKEPTIFRTQIDKTSYSPEAQTTTFTVYCDVAWAVKTDSQWLTVSPSSGKGDATNGEQVTITLKFNKETSSRNGAVTVSAGTKTSSLTLSQKPLTEMFPETEVFIVKKQTYKFVVISRNEWTASLPADADWLHIEPKSGSGTVSVYMTPSDANENVGDRKTTLTFTMGGDKVEIPVTQRQTNVLLLGESQYINDYQAGTFEVPSNTNVDFQVVIPAEAADWLKFVETKALNSRKTTFRLEQNTGFEPRRATVSFKYGDDINETFQVEQAPYNEVLGKTVPGIYGVEGKNYIYTAGKDQLSVLRTADNKLALRILRAEDVQVAGVSGVPADASFGTELNVTVAVLKGRDIVVRKATSAYILKADDKNIWLTTPDGIGAILKK